MINQNDILISVLLPVYNAEKYIEEAVDSILNQTYSNFELIILNDGSTDRSIEIIESKKDQRIRIEHNEKNLGLIATLNKGLGLAKGKYIARMDADDISLPERFTKQVSFLEDNCEVGVLGANIEVFGQESGSSKLWEHHEQIQVVKYFENPIAHPTVMLRSSVLETEGTRYNSEMLHVEDWALWMDLSKVTKLHNLPEVLLKYRLEGQNITVKNHDSLKVRMFVFYKTYLTDLFEKMTDEDCQEHWNFIKAKYDVKVKRSWLELNEFYSCQFIKIGIRAEQFEAYFESIKEQLFYGMSNESPKEAINYARKTKQLSFQKLIYAIKKMVKS